MRSSCFCANRVQEFNSSSAIERDRNIPCGSRISFLELLILFLLPCDLNLFAYGPWALESKSRNLVFTHECDARMRLSVGDELFEHLGARRSTGDAIVGADGHDTTPPSGFGIECVELRLEIVGIHNRAEVSWERMLVGSGE